MKLKKVLFIVILFLGLLIMASSVSNASNETIPFEIKVYQDYNAAYKVLDSVNKERKAVGKSELKMDKDLLENAMVRASEIVFDFSHTRPNNTSCFTIIDKPVEAMGENIAVGYVNSEDVMIGWMNSEGHKNNILDTYNYGFTTIGIGAVKYEGVMYWVQIFGKNNLANANKPSNGDKTRKVDISIIKDGIDNKGNSTKVPNVELQFITNSNIIKSKDSKGVLVKIKASKTGWASKVSTEVDQNKFTYESSNKSIFIVDNKGIIKPIACGTAELTVQLKKDKSVSLKQQINVKEDLNYLDISDIKDTIYTGKNIKPNVTIKDGNYKLIKDKDYELQYSNNKKCGEATVVIKGIGKYTGTVSKKFKILPQKVTELKQNETTENSVKISWKKLSGVTGYKVYLYNDKTNKYEHYITTKETNVKIKKLKAVTKYNIKVKAYKNNNGIQYNGSKSSALKVMTAPKKVNKLKVKTKSKNSIKLNWKKVNGATGYKVYIYNAKTKKYEYYGKTKSTSITIKKLSKNKSYKIKVRAYKTFQGKQYFGENSNVLKVTTLKK